MLAAQFGYAPGLLWLVGGVCLAGAVQDSFWLWASVAARRTIARRYRAHRGQRPGRVSPPRLRSCLILIVALAGLGIAVVNALAESAWATFTMFATIPLALVMGFYMFRWRTGHVKEATIVGVTVMFLGVVFGKNVRRVLDRPLVRALAPSDRHRDGAATRSRRRRCRSGCS